MSDKNKTSRESSMPQHERASPRKRFHIQKLEERIAPKKGGKGTNNCSGGDSSNQAESSGSVSAY